jgi:hypothetical protein
METLNQMNSLQAIVLVADLILFGVFSVMAFNLFTVVIKSKFN